MRYFHLDVFITWTIAWMLGVQYGRFLFGQWKVRLRRIWGGKREDERRENGN